MPDAQTKGRAGVAKRNMDRAFARMIASLVFGGSAVFGQPTPIDCRDARKPEIRCPLASARVDVELAGPLAVTRWTLAFRNPGESAAEGRLEVNLPSGIEVSGYALEVGGKMRDGVVVPRGLARASYQEIVDRRVDPGILEITPTGFVTRLFPIPGGGTKAIRVELAGIRRDAALRLPVPGGDDTMIEWQIRCRDPKPPVISEGTREWRNEDGGWMMSGESRAAQLAAMRLESVAATPAWAVTEEPGRAWVIGRVPVAGKEVAREAPAKLSLWWDGSLAGRNRDREAVIGCLANLLERMDNGEVVLRVFREAASPAERFEVSEGGCSALLARLRDEPAEGMARFDGLEGGIGAGMILVVSEGITPLPACRPRFAGGTAFDVLDPSGQGGGLLGIFAARAGGEVRNPSEGDWSLRHPVPAEWRDDGARTCRREGDCWIVAGETKADRFDKLPDGFSRTPHARHAWAVERFRQMEALQVAHADRIGFARGERVLGPETAFLVLDALDDYARYGIEPPEPELRAQWAAAREKWREKEPDAGKRLAEWTTVWRKQQDARESPQADYATRLAAVIDQTGERWKQLDKRFAEKIAPGDSTRLDEMRAQTRRVRAATDDGKERLRQLSAIGADWERLVGEVNKRLGTMHVLVAGHVRQPGPLEVPQGMTIAEAIEAAGGATEFGSLKRVCLRRGGKQRQLDLRTETFRNLLLEPNDTVEVPQKMVWGDDGGAVAGESAATPQGLVASLRTPGADAGAPDLVAIANLLEKGGDWQAACHMTGQGCGWSGDFLRQVGALLEERGMKDEARRVAGSLAQTAPDDPGTLRRAAEALGRTGGRETARLLLEKLHQSDPDDPAPLLSIARLHRDSGELAEAVRAYAAVTERAWKPGHVGIWMCALTEVNALLHRHGEKLASGIVDPSRVRPLAADLRVVVEHDLSPPFAYFEIACTDPLGSRMCRGNWLAGQRWEDFAPTAVVEEVIHTAAPGTHRFRVSHPGQWQGRGPLVTIEADLFLNFGRPNETRRRVFLRLDSYGYAEVARVSWKLAE